MEETFRRKLHDHEKNAIIDALAILETVEDAKNHIQDGTIDTLRAMVGIRGTFPQYMNDAIAECVEKEGCIG